MLVVGIAVTRIGALLFIAIIRLVTGCHFGWIAPASGKNDGCALTVLG